MRLRVLIVYLLALGAVTVACGKRPPVQLVSQSMKASTKAVSPTVESDNGVGDEGAESLPADTEKCFEGSTDTMKDESDRASTEGETTDRNVQRHVLLKHEGGISAVAISSDGKLLATGNPFGNIRVWDFESKETLRDYTNHMPGKKYAFKEGVSELSFSRKNELLVSAGNDGTVRAFSFEKNAEIWAIGPFLGTEYAEYNEAYAVSCSPTEDLVVAGFRDESIRLIDLNTGKVLRRSKGNFRGWVSDVAFSPNGKQYAGGSASFVNIWDTKTGKLRRKYKFARDFDSSSLAYSSNGKWLLAGGCYESALISTDSRKINFIRVISVSDSVAFSSDAKILAISNEFMFMALDISKEQRITRFVEVVPKNFQSSETTVLFTPDGRGVFFAGSRNEDLLYYDINKDLEWKIDKEEDFSKKTE